jgi:tryptophanyl-tRNA synthetase
LAWILSCFTGMGEMSRMTQFKDKSSKLSEDRISVGLFMYPILMAADMLLYDAEYVPVGDDQTQHLEFTRDIAERFNNQFGETFKVPRPVKAQHEFFGKDQGLRIRDLQDPTKKMSKSDETGKGVVFMGDAPEAAAKKIMSATTDSLGSIHYDYKEQPGISNLLEIYALMKKQPIVDVAIEWEGKSSYGELKSDVAELVRIFLTEFQERLQQVDDQRLFAKLEQDEAAMSIVADTTLLRAQKAVGLRA